MERFYCTVLKIQWWYVLCSLFVKPVFLQILGRQNKHQRNKNKDEEREESEPEEKGGLFDDWMIKHFSNKSVLTCWQNITAEETSPCNEENPVSARGFITDVVTASQSGVKLWRASENTQLFDLVSICKKRQKLFDCYTKDTYSLDWLGCTLLRMYYSYNTEVSICAKSGSSQLCLKDLSRPSWYPPLVEWLQILTLFLGCLILRLSQT